MYGSNSTIEIDDQAGSVYRSQGSHSIVDAPFDRGQIGLWERKIVRRD
jgi:hypothetical protein